METGGEPMEILKQLESGNIGVEEAVKRLGSAGDGGRGAEEGDARGWMSWWWLAPFFIGVGLTALGGWLGALGGWWWLGAAPALLVGIPLMTLAAISRDSPWVEIRFHTTRRSGSHRFFISLPIPVRLAAGAVRLVGPWIRSLDATVIDEFLMALDGSLSRDRPLVVEVSESEEGERVVVSFR
jgi:hypothetical protein